MLCAYVLQCGRVQRINDYGFECSPSVCCLVFFFGFFSPLQSAVECVKPARHCYLCSKRALTFGCKTRIHFS